MIEKGRSLEFTSLLGLKETLDGPVRASGVRWYGRVLRRDNDEGLRKELDFEAVEKRGCGGTNRTRERQVERYIDKIVLNKEDAMDRTKWCNGVYELSRNVR